jgi:hypothetical protein
MPGDLRSSENSVSGLGVQPTPGNWVEEKTSPTASNLRFNTRELGQFVGRGFRHTVSVPKTKGIVILAPGSAAKRRRRCVVCMRVGEEGLECPGRGKRELCPHLTNGRQDFS